MTQSSDRSAAAAGYGDSFADVYDAWYSDDASGSTSGDVAGVVALSRRFFTGDVLELGAGTGRLTLPLARAVAPRRVVALDASPAMLERLRAKLDATHGARNTENRDAENRNTVNIEIVCGDMSDDDVPQGPFSLVVVSYNTVFNLPDEAAQRRCFATIAARLTADGACVIDCFVPDDDPAPLGVTRDVRNGVRVVTATYTDARHRVVNGITEEHRPTGTVLRPWRVAYASPDLLDDMAAAANLRLVERRAGWNGEIFGESSNRHVSIYAPAHRTLTA